MLQQTVTHLKKKKPCFSGKVDHGGALLWPDTPFGGGHCQAVCGRIHGLDDGPGVTEGLDATACGEGAQHVHPDYSQTPLQRLCAKVCGNTSVFFSFLFVSHINMRRTCKLLTERTQEPPAVRHQC